MTSTTSVEEFATRANKWLESALPRTAQTNDDATNWAAGDEDVSVFRLMSHEDEIVFLDGLRTWQRRKLDAGFAGITVPAAHGGQGLTADHEAAFRELEAQYEIPGAHELLAVTLKLVIPTLLVHGTATQIEQFVPPLLRADDYACQLFSEPGAGSDLASLATRAARQGDEWVINGQKVWSSGAQFAGWGLLIARTDPSVAKHKGLTAFMLPLDTPGVDVRPLKQITGGSSFAEVFLDDVRIPDAYRIGEIGEGWRVTLTTLTHERGSSGSSGKIGGTWQQLRDLALWTGAFGDPVARQSLADAAILHRLGQVTAEYDRERRAAGDELGPAGSYRKLQWVERMKTTSDVAREILGPRLLADTGEWGTFAWVQHVLGAPGYRVAGGADQIQRTIIGERVLGLPAGPRADRDLAWNELPR